MAFDVEAAKQEGYTDEEIQAYLRSEQGTPVPVQEQPGRGAEVAATAVGAVPTALSYAPEAAAAYGLFKYGPDIARSAGNIISKMSSLGSQTAPTIGTPANPIGSAPVATPTAPTAPTAPAVAPQQATISPSRITSMIKNAAGMGARMAGPVGAMSAPYAMAAYEQDKIRQNPNAAGLESNPYAQTIRGEAGTQAQAGEGNRMKALANMPYGNVSPQERAMLEEDARMRSAIRKKAFEKVMGPVAPGQF